MSKTPEQRERAKQASTRYRERNPERVKEHARAWRERNREKIRNQERCRREMDGGVSYRAQQAEWARKRRAKDPEYFQRYFSNYHRKRRSDALAVAKIFLGKAQKRAVVKGMEFDLFEHFDEIVERIARWRCELSGVKLESGVGRKIPNSISIDRIDSSRGYTIDNIRFVAWLFNAAFSDWGEEVTARAMRRWLFLRDIL